MSKVIMSLIQKSPDDLVAYMRKHGIQNLTLHDEQGRQVCLTIDLLYSPPKSGVTTAAA